MKLGILTDVHEDIVSLEKALRLLEKEGCDHIACLGDSVGYCELNIPFVKVRDANACLMRIRENCTYVISGNHDINAIRRLPAADSGFVFPENWYALNAGERKEISEGRVWLYEDELPTVLTDENSDYLRSLPETTIIEQPDARILLSHFLYPDLSGVGTWFPMQRKEIFAHFEYMHSQNCNLSIFGHVHPVGILKTVSSGRLFSALREPFDFLPLGSYKLTKKDQAYAVPAVVAGERKSGVSILDTDVSKISAIQL